MHVLNTHQHEDLTCLPVCFYCSVILFNLFWFFTDAGILPTLQDSTPLPVFVVLAGILLVSSRVVQMHVVLFCSSEEVNTCYIGCIEGTIKS